MIINNNLGVGNTDAESISESGTGHPAGFRSLIVGTGYYPLDNQALIMSNDAASDA